MDALSAHPDWCRRVGCALNGTHESDPVVLSSDNDFVSLTATLVQLDDLDVRTIRLRFTDEGVTTSFSLPLRQARTLSDALAVFIS